MIFVADDIEKPPEKGLHRLVTQVPCHFVFPPVRQLCLGQFPFLLASLASKLAKELSCFKSSGEENVGRYLPPLPSGFCAVSLHKFPTVPSPPDGPPSPDVHLGVGMVLHMRDVCKYLLAVLSCQLSSSVHIGMSLFEIITESYVRF